MNARKTTPTPIVQQRFDFPRFTEVEKHKNQSIQPATVNRRLTCKLMKASTI